MTLDPQDLRAFARVADLGGVTAAAKSLGAPKSSVSRALARLEASLGVVLVERSTRHLKLTEAGLLFRGHVARITRELEEAEAAIEQLKGFPRGTLRVDAPYAFTQYVLAPMLADFGRAHPELRVLLSVTNRRIDPLTEDVDAVIRIGESRASNLISRRIMSFTDWLCASPRYLADRGTPKAAEELSRHDLLATGGTVRWTMQTETGPMDLALPRANVSVPEPAALRALLVAGSGIGRLPDFIAAGAVASGELVRLLPEVSFERRNVFVLCPTRARLARVRILTDALISHIVALGWQRPEEP